MALKLGKCRLCLKLGDFYSIWAADGGVRLADMAMALASLKIYEGDGLPDKVCSECVEKLSCAYIFKLQCERADQDLRRNYIPPPGFSHTPPPPNRQSSDSGYSHRTDVSIQPKHVPQPEEPAVASSSKRKRKRKADDFGRNTSLLQESFSMNLASPAQSDHSRPKTPDKKPRYEEDSDYEYTGAAMADSDFEGDPNEHKCPKCDKQFQSKKSLSQHYRIHKREEKQNESNSSLQENVVVDIPQGEDDGLGCSTCGKTFKLQIMLKRHILSCQDNPAEDQISETEQGKLTCKYCHMKFKANANLAKHMRVVHAAVLKEDTPKGNKIAMVPCLHCDTIFIEFEAYKKHFDFCPRRKNVKSYACKACDKDFPVRSTYIRHIKLVHFGIRVPRMNESSSFVADDAEQASFDCRICSRKLATQDQLVAHLAAHMSNMDTDESRGSTLDESSQNSNFSLKSCPHCDRVFKYNKSLETHIIVQHSRQSLEVKVEPELPFMNETNIESDGDDSSQGDNDNTCDICEKIFSYKKTLEHHKRTKHNSTSGMKRSKINVRKCKVTCLICNISMQVFELKVHNQMHIDEKVKPKNLYSCSECSNTFSCVSALSGHIKLVHRLNQQMPDGAGYEVTNVANFCEVVVTKSEPLDTVQSHNDDTTVPRKLVLQPVVDLSGFTCPLCSKKMGNLLSLKRHINWHNNKGNSMMKKLDCKICDMTFKFDSHYKLHMKDHYYDLNLDPKFLTCTICNRVSKHLRAAQAHNNWHKQTRFNTKDYQCSICKKIFQYRRVYLYHMAVHYKKGDSIEKTKDLPIEAGSGNGDSHKCPHCQKVLDSANSLKCHMAWHRSKSSLYGSRYECDLCKTQFTNKRRHELHLRTHYEDENGPFKCPICSKGYNEENFFQRHVKSHNFDRQDQVKRKQRVQEIRDKKVKCPICCRYYPDLAKLIGHLKRSHPESKMVKPDPDAEVQKSHFSCKLCAKIFFNEKRLQFHEESHLRKPTHYKCKFCGKKAASLKMHNVHVKGHLTKNYHDDPLKCPHCEEKFVRGYALHHHIMDVHGIRENWIAERSTERVLGPLKELQCDVCLKILASKGNYERHIDYHNTLRCNYCFEFFNGRVFLDGHLAYSCEKKKLIGETEVYPKKVKCNVCYKAFHLQIKLDCHLHTQHGVKLSDKTFESKQEHVCDYCFRVFENEEALTGHKIYHRSVGFYGCIYCKRKFNSVTTYNKHKNHHFYQLHEEDPVKCEHCDERFVVFKEMIHHMRDEHGDNKEWITMPKETVEEECDICHKRFDNLPRHLRYHQENRCKKCREYFFSRTDYDQHMCAIESDEEDVLTQDGEEKPAYSECTFCFKPITGKKMTKIFHDRIHSISHKISCRLCPAKFKTVEAFNIHAFSHRSRKYKKNPLTCPLCKEKFVQYGPFVKHMRGVHDVHDKMHYRATVLPDECVVCRGVFPNLHNHYRAHLQHACFACKKYFTSQKLFMAHSCDKEDADPTKVFTCDENLYTLINNYVPREENYEAKYYGKTDEEDSAEINGENDSKEPKESNCAEELKGQQGSSAGAQQFDHAPIIISKVLSLHKVQGTNETGSRVSNGSVNDNGDDCIVICDDDNEPSIDPVTINLDD